MGIIEIIWFIFMTVVLPLIAYFVVERIGKLAKLDRSKRISIYASVVVAALVGWFAAQLFIPLSVIALNIIPFAVLVMNKVPAQRAVIASVSFGILYIILEIAATYAMIVLNGFS